jgi:hypothetical protein
MTDLAPPALPRAIFESERRRAPLRGFFASLAPEWRVYWFNAYVRGAVSGLGIVNVYIALLEIFRLRRFARR